uniref:Uncharacterized protein n=1 Tax=Siphoviridae sp. ct3pR10 TaxID=2826284 RepID=A0A8S5LWV7_9CAUD|nr:MAG TPA: hypothetical protein [Siphoviridae sp. ct3pR10]DAH22842.1 MAG TPA: hypothetical protein [Caudoviricetes sp.]
MEGTGIPPSPLMLTQKSSKRLSHIIWPLA